MMWGHKQEIPFPILRLLLIPIALLLLHPLCPNTFSTPFVTLLGVLVLLLLLFTSSSASHLPPGPPSLPWIGNLAPLDPEAPYETLTNLLPKYGKVIMISYTYSPTHP